ncbi:antitoxin, type II toxin-antitoxin system family protein (plasmid) [Ochrobactrum quorumnocens]|uniref:Antitoxin, type II toxin-antitoxin system family protein n=2 Tax=Ochrobactrum quorumnocens TaxID=271865 RepID=A0A248UP37_9HYPH|nr:antitoxin, type II toxin-antitoxin system family protein [[Ochrobactrum] quorumnocens]
MGTVRAGEGAAVAILNRNEPAFYCVPASVYEVMLERLEDAALSKLTDERVADLGKTFKAKIEDGDIVFDD